MKLFTPIKIGPLTLKNRVVLPAMHMVYTPDNEVTDQICDFYAARAAGGVALTIVGGCGVDEYSGMFMGLSLKEDAYIPGMARLAAAIHDNGGLAAAQLYHAGRYAFSATIGGRQSLSASAVRSRFTREEPKEMSTDDIKFVIKNFAEATRRAREAGYDAVEILGSAGYLISQFLSPITNYRTDEYGGSFENRMRFGLEVSDAVREAAGPDMAVIIRLAGNDFMPGSNVNENSAEFATHLEKRGVDCINVTGGWHETRVPQIPMNLPRGGYVYLAQGIKEKTSLPVIACNRINNPELAEKILRQNRADLIGVGRGHIADPDWCRKAEEGRSDEINVCIGCNQGCFDHVFLMQPVGCMVNPLAGFEGTVRVTPATEKKKVMVIGGGPAGLMFASTAAGRGHDVALYEKSGRLGGQIPIAAALHERREFMSMIKSFTRQCELNGVKIVMNREVDEALIEWEKPDVIAAATGGGPMEAPFAGGDLPNVVQAWDVLTDKADTGNKIVVCGGGAVGSETALYLAAVGALTPDELHFLFLHQAESIETLTQLATRGVKNVVMVEMTGRIGSDIGQSTGWIVRQDLGRAGVNVMTNTKALEITEKGLKALKGEEEIFIPADTVVLALGTKPNTELFDKIKDKYDNVVLVGDAIQPGKAYDAVHSAFRAAIEV